MTRDKNILEWLLSFAKPFRNWLIIAFLSMILVACFEIAIPYKIKEIVDGLISNEMDKQIIVSISTHVLLLISGILIFSSVFSCLF